MSERIAKSRFFNQLLNSLVPFLSWLLITFPLWFSPFHPAVVAYFIIGFDLYFFYKAMITVYRAVIAYKKVLLNFKINFVNRIKKIKDAETVNHFIIIPNYKETLSKLEITIDSFVKNDYPFKKIYLVLAFEDRETDATAKARELIKKYGHYFSDIIQSYHILSENEAPGKASNQTFAAHIIDNYINKNGLNDKTSLITICDADSYLPKNYFSYLTYEYLKDTGRLHHFYCAPVLLYNNFWKLPFFVRMQATLSSVIRLAFLEYKRDLIQISTYSTNFWMLKQLGFWDVDIIPEDWHIYLQAFFKFGKLVRTMPLYTIVNGDAVFSGNLLKTSTNRYEQEKRWAWGVSDIGYALKNCFSSPHVDPITKLRKVLFMVETHLMWPVSFFILTVSASIPPLINPVFKRTVLGFLLPQLSALILTTSSLMIVIYVYLDIKLRQRVNQKTTYYALPLLLIQWYLLPFVSFLFSSLPALDAHTRILLGRKMEYKVTEKA